MRAWPVSGSERPTSIRIVVVLPAPLGPRKPVTVPGSQRNVTSETTLRPPSCLVSPLTSIMPADWRPAGIAATVGGLRSPRPAAVVDNDFGRGSRPWRSPSLDPRAMARQGTARFTDGLSGWLRSALPGAVIDAPDEERGRRDRVVDATIYLVALAIGAATLADAWQGYPPWLRIVAVVAGIAALVSLHRRRTHPAAVGIGVGAVSLVIITSGGANLAATFNAAIRARGRDLAVIVGLLIAWAFASPLLYPPAGSYWANAGACVLVTGVVLGWGLYVRARRELVRSLREQADRAADEARAAERRRIAREMHDVLAHRLSLLSVHAGALEFHPDAPAEEVAEAAGVIRQSAKTALEELRSVIGVLREDSGESLTQPPQPTLADLAALVEESPGGRHADHRPNRAGRRSAASRRRTHRVPDRAGGPDERAQARAGSSGDPDRPRARRRPAGRSPQPRGGGRRRGRAAARRGDGPDRARRARFARRRHARARRRPRRRVRPACEPATMIRVLLVDDDALVRSGLRIMLAGAANLDVVAEAADG